MKVKTAELRGVQLDYAVAKAIGQKLTDEDFDKQTGVLWFESEHEWRIWTPSTDWSQCGPLIEAEDIEFKWVSDATLEAHSYLHDPHYGYGLTHQEAACRLIVASKLGDEVDIPDELMEGQQ